MPWVYFAIGCLGVVLIGIRAAFRHRLRPRQPDGRRELLLRAIRELAAKQEGQAPVVSVAPERTVEPERAPAGQTVVLEMKNDPVPGNAVQPVNEEQSAQYGRREPPQAMFAESLLALDDRRKAERVVSELFFRHMKEFASGRSNSLPKHLSEQLAAFRSAWDERHGARK
jgi:hypothetical protein